jgi:hypothetical protein
MNSLHHTLDSLPKTLDETYYRILSNVHEHNQSLVQQILQCVRFFKRSISVEEVRHICHIGNYRKPPFDSEDALFNGKDVIHLCGGLLCLVVQDWAAGTWAQWRDEETVQLAHFSVKEYLLSARAMSWRLDEELQAVPGSGSDPSPPSPTATYIPYTPMVHHGTPCIYYIHPWCTVCVWQLHKLPYVVVHTMVHRVCMAIT